MQIGIFAKTFTGSNPLDVMAAAAAAGFASVQYNMACSGLPSMPDTISAGEARDVASAARLHQVPVAAVSGTYNMIHPDSAVRAKGLARLNVLASRCAEMATGMITLCTGTRDAEDQWRHHQDNASTAAWHDLRQAMEAALAIAERHDVTLGIEPELANVVSSAAKAKKLLDELRSPRLKIVLDAANLFEQESLADQRRIVSTAIDTLGDHITMAHAKDRAADGSFIAVGKGVLDFNHYISCLRTAGFAGVLVTHGLSAAEAPGVARFLGAVLAEAGVGAR